MKDYRNQDGIVSAIILILLLLIILVGGYIALDYFNYIDVPNEYSLVKMFNLEEENIYKVEAIEASPKQVREKVKNRDFENADSNLYISDSVNKKDKNEDETDDYPEEYDLYYYSQLDDTGKIIYNGIVDNIENMKQGDYSIDFGKAFNDLLQNDDGSDIMNSSFQSAVNAVLLDNPEVFFLDITKMYLFTRSTTYSFIGTTYEVSIGPNVGDTYLGDSFTKTKINLAEKDIKNIKDEVIKDLSGDEIEKIRQVHDFLVRNLEYDSAFSNDNVYNIYGALIDKSTVCEGYAKAFKYFMDQIEIPCVVVCGTAQNSKGVTENHAWNYVYIDGNWYAIDVTWDDPIIIGSGKVSEETRYKYFLKGSETMDKDHEENGNVVDNVHFKYPKLSKSDY